jgi:NitT/TauT family transport system permease protein
VKFLKAAVFPIAFLVMWQAWMSASGIQSDSLAAPADIVVAFWGAIKDGTIASRTLETLESAVAGLLIGGGSALVMSVVLGLVQPAARLAQFSIEVLRPIPAVALIPVGLMVLGFGYSMEIALISFACFWPVLIYGQSAITTIEPQLLDVSRVLRLSAFGRVTKIVLPAALPRYFVGFRLSAAISLIIAVTVEIAANPQGLGYELMMAAQSLHPARMFAFLLWIGLIGWALNWALLFAQRRLFGNITVAAAEARAQ